MITRFNNVKMASDTSKSEYYLVTPEANKEEKEFHLPADIGPVTVLMVGNKDHDE